MRRSGARAEAIESTVENPAFRRRKERLCSQPRQPQPHVASQNPQCGVGSRTRKRGSTSPDDWRLVWFSKKSVTVLCGLNWLKVTVAVSQAYEDDEACGG